MTLGDLPFQGEHDADQLGKIIEILGTPTIVDGISNRNRKILQ
jgi:hypothetical protein